MSVIIIWPLAYSIREATLVDSDALVRHRLAMFRDMGVPFDPTALDTSFRRWLAEMMPAGTYCAWVVEAIEDVEDEVPRAGTRRTDRPPIVAGGGATVLPWPPGPRDLGHRLAFVYNVYVEPAHRRRGLARQIMDAIHTFCQRRDIASVALNASRDGLSLYRTMGYVDAPAPMMFFAVKSDQQV
jgi:GNAT superfamily N-acetyltransferase